MHIVFDDGGNRHVGVRKQRLYPFDKSFLSIRKKDKAVIDKVTKTMCLDDISKVLEKPKPVRVIFSIYNGVSKREQRAICIDSCQQGECLFSEMQRT